MASKAKLSNIYDVSLSNEPPQGDPILFQNPEIRKMLRLANVGMDDVIFDLGCGWGQNLIIALTEFNAKYGVGFELDEDRHEMAEERIEDWNLTDRCKILKANFEDYLGNKLKETNKLPKPTVIFYGLSTSKRLFSGIAKKLKKGDRLVYYYNCLFPEIIPTEVDFPFYVSEFPFRRPKSNLQWLLAVIMKEESSIHSGKKPSERELWQELLHDYDVRGDPDDIQNYRGRLARL